MKTLQLIFVAGVIVLTLSACGQDGVFGVTLILDGEHTIDAGEQVRGELVVMGGQVMTADGSHVTGSVYVLSGTLTANGAIDGDLTVLGGDVLLESRATVDGDLGLGGGTLEQAPGATVHGEVTTSAGIDIPLTPEWTDRSVGNWLRAFLITTIMPALLAYAAARIRPQLVGRVAGAVVEQPVVSAALGLLALVVGLVLLVFMVFTIVLIPVTVLGLILLALLVTYGWIAIGFAVGQRLARWREWEMRPSTTALVGTVLLTVVMNGLNLVPIVGALVPLTAMAIGFGAVLLTRFGTRRFVPRAAPAEPG